MGAHCRSKLRYANKHEFYGMSTTASQSTSAAKNMKGANAASKKKAAPKFKSSYTSMITEAIQDLKQKNGSTRHAIIKHITETSNIVPNALVITKTIEKMIEDGKLVPAAREGSFKISPQEKLRIMQAETKTIKKMIEDGKLVPAAQAGHSGAGSFKISPQEKPRIMQAEKSAAKRDMKEAAGIKSADGAKKVARKSVGVKEVAKKSAKESLKLVEKGKGLKLMGLKLMKKGHKKGNVEAKKSVA